MSRLDVIKLHSGLQLEHGLDAGYLSDKSSTTSTYLLSPDGLPLNVGWFENSKRSLKYPDAYALTTYPPAPRNMHHRLMLQQARGSEGITLVEEDAADYLEGLDDYPHTLRNEGLQQPGIDRLIRELGRGAYVLNATTGLIHANFAWDNDYDVAAVREHGLDIIRAGDVLAIVDDHALDRYAQTDPPASH